MSRHRVLVAITSSAGLLAAIASLGAQTETDSAKSARHDKEAADLAKQAQNPVANMVSLPLQYNYYTGGGLGSTSELILNVQPVLPLEINKQWLLISRTVVPFTSVPIPLPLADTGRRTGTADIQEQAYFTPAKPGKVTWAVGPIFSFPTATNNVVRTGQWGLGPTAVALVMPKTWVIGMLVNNIWRIGGDNHGVPLNTFTLQPFINFNLPHAWALSTAPLVTSNWSAPSGQRWTVPLGGGVSKIAHVADQPMNFELQYYHNVEHPRNAGSNSVRLEAAALWPTTSAKAAKEEEAKTIAAKKKASKEGGKNE